MWVRAWLHATNEGDIIHIVARALTDLDLAGRVNALIERYFGGNALKAARAWMVPQPTVHRLGAGITRSPRAVTLRQIAHYHATTVEWLLEGTGPNPLETPALPMVEYLEFRDAVDRLGLDAETRWAVLSLPTTIGAAHTILCRWGLDFSSEYVEEAPRVVAESRDAAWKAAAMQYLSWAHLLEGLIRAYGRTRVRDKLRSELARLHLGLHPIAMELLHVEGGPILLETKILPRIRTGGSHAGTIMIDLPAIPPLDAEPPERRAPGRGRPRKTRPHYRYDEDTDATN